ncbi:MAG: LysE family translocator [Bacteroidetes bacterium]|jgi:aminoacid exporter|nr:MAG: LysE family translocator [Bacteroidota bacterium]
MIDIIITGIIIGILVSAPTGPLGILCIQRTLHKGRLHGFVTGLGASTSDIIYAILVGFSMNFIIEFVEQYRFIIQIIGSIILLLFGYIIYSNNPEEELADKKIGTSNRNLFSTYTSAFGLCFSNPIIIFFFIALFARFKFFSPSYNIYQVLIGLASILIGTLIWWLSLTMIVGIFRHRFKARGLRILNRITGGVLMLLSVAGVVLGLLGKTF